MGKKAHEDSQAKIQGIQSTDACRMHTTLVTE